MGKQKTKNSKHNIEGKEQSQRKRVLSHLKTYYIATVIKTVWNWWKNRQANQWNRIETLEMKPDKYSQPIFEKEAKVIQ